MKEPSAITTATPASRNARTTLSLEALVLIGAPVASGATLWTDFNLFGSQTAAMYHAHGMNDFRIIRYTDGGQERTFTPFDSLKLHEA